MRVVVPYDATAPKTRLAPVLDADEREAFAEAMLIDVVTTIETVEKSPEVLATAPVDVSVPVTVDDRSLTTAVNTVLESAEHPVAVVMADLALAVEATLRHFFDATGAVVIAPGVGGGTNALVIRHPEFRVDYHGASVRDHRHTARTLGASLTHVDSMRLAIDIDEPRDLPEVLLHGEGAAASWLRDRFRIVTTDGRVDITRQ